MIRLSGESDPEDQENWQIVAEGRLSGANGCSSVWVTDRSMVVRELNLGG